MDSADTLLPASWSVPERISQRLGREPGPQRAMLEDGHLLIILHQLPNPDEHRRKAALFWRQPEGTWTSNLEGPGPTALQGHLHQFDEKLAALELVENQASTASEYHAVLEQIAPVLRASRGLHRALQQARALLKTDRELINLRDQAAGVERNAELLLQDAQFGLNFIAARQAEAQATAARQMAATSHRLNLLAAFFLPLTAMASLFGMEIHSRLPDTPSNFLIICLAGFAVGVFVMTLLRRKA